MAAPQQWHELDGAQIDLVIIGGGISGAGALWDAALRGMSVVLFEQRDFASGTSSRSSKLIHGGLRYLQQGNIKLIYEAVNERRRLRELARHLVRPLGFYFPCFKGQFPSKAVMGAGLFVYEALTGFRVDKIHRRLSAAQTAKEIPGIRQNNLSGGLFYYDAKAADARIVWECILAGREAGGGAFNYCQVQSAMAKDGFWHISVVDQQQGAAATVKAKAVLAAVGPWGNTALKQLFPELQATVRPTKGVHLVLPVSKLPVSEAVTLQHPRDKRVTFIIPGRGYVYTGTTDTDFTGDIAEPGVTAEDVNYLLENLNYYFPAQHFSFNDVTATWSGLRPLIQQAGKSAYQVSREHQISQIKPNFLTIEGGKLTTFRVMAKQAIDAVESCLGQKFEPCTTAKEPLPGGRGIYSEADLVNMQTRTRQYLNCDADIAHHLVYQYGTRVLEVLPYVAAEPERAISGLPQTWGEIQFMIEQEAVLELEDLFLRRSEIYYQAPDNGLSIVNAVAERLQKHTQRSPEWQAAAIKRYRDRCAQGLNFKK